MVTKIKKKLDIHMMEIVRGASLAFVLKVVAAGLSFIFNVLIARMLGAEGAGVYFLAITVTTIARTIGAAGLDNTLLRFTAIHAAKNEWGTVSAVYRRGLCLAAAFTLVVTVVLISLAPWLARELFDKPDVSIPLRWLALAMLPMVLLALQGQMFKGLKRIRDSILVNGIAVPLLSILGLIAFGKSYGVVGAVWASGIAALLTMVGGGFLWRTVVPAATQRAEFPLRMLLQSCRPLFVVNMMGLVTNSLPMFLLGIWGTTADVGVYGAALRTALLTSFILVAVNSVVAPKFASLFSQGDMQTLASTARNTTRMVAAFATPILAAFLIVPDWVMGVFGHDFTSGGSLLAVLAIGQFVNVCTGSVGFLLSMTGNEHLLRNSAIAAALLQCLLCVFLIPAYQAWGAAISVAVVMIFQNLLSMYLVRRKLGFWVLSLNPNRSV